MDDAFKLYDEDDDTIIGLRRAVEARDLQRLADAVRAEFRSVRKDFEHIEERICARIETAEKKIMEPKIISRLVKNEVKGDPRVGKLETDVKRLWWLVGILTVAIIGLAIAKALK